MNNIGRKPEGKLWLTEYRHTLRAKFLNDPDIHLLIFAAGENTTDLLKAALREFIENHDLPFGSSDFQTGLFMQASKMFTETRQSPSPDKVFDGIGYENPVQDAILDKGYKPKTAPDLKIVTKTASKPKADKQALAVKAVEKFSASIPVEASVNQTGKPSLSQLFSSEVEISDDPYGSEPDKATSLKSKWLQGHVY